MDKYSQALLNSASRLDATAGACGEITKLATAVVEEKKQSSYDCAFAENF